MMERVPRSLLALTVIVVVVALYVGIEDYVQQKNAPPPVSTSAATAGDSHAKTDGKKTASAKTGRIRLRASKGNAAATARVGADANEKSSINQESNSGVQDQLVNDNAPSTTATADDAGEAAIGQDNRGNKLDARTALSELTAQCVPLPNVTNPKDVDAPYYLNWAREYWCYDSIPSAVARGN
jgi:uncharacterized protein with FMN-binding domain